ncbi:MAG: glycosyltransferase [Thiovulaceae bacterium]|nr:glycosyltransferase [Sulfurimonadaceae bacterium]
MQKKVSIHQFTPTLAYGDGVSNGLFFTQKILKQLGFDSNIYICTTYTDIDIKKEIFHISQYEPSIDNFLFYHHSIGHECHDNIMKFLDQKILVYHNITPSHFFINNEHLQGACDLGREQIKNSLHCFMASYADSNYNCKELLSYGFKNPVSIPLLLDTSLHKPKAEKQQIIMSHQDSYNILFVGRIVQNKCQHQLIDTLYILKKSINLNVKLFLVGSTSQDDYLHFLKRYIQNLSLQDNVILTGKVDDETLSTYYENSDLYLSLSEHEGFGIPLLEAMKYDKPVLAYNAGSISEIVTPEGLLKRKSADFVASKIEQILKSPQLRVEMIKKQKLILKKFTYESLYLKFVDFLKSLDIAIPNEISHFPQTSSKLNIQVEGPFDSTYSLAQVNKNIAKALQNDANVKLYSTEGYGDFPPNITTLDEQTLMLYNNKQDSIDITIRNLYPPRTNTMRGYHKIIGPYGWEESKFPQEFVESFNKNLTLIFTMSHYVENLLITNGIALPIATTGIIAEDILHINPKAFTFDLPNGFRLLHISSCFPRKGADILLNVFDLLNKEITLIVKTFPNPHNDILKQIDNLNFTLEQTYEKDIFLYSKDGKKILLINKDIPQSQINYLYQNSNSLVAPSLGEGFGLPMAEAMLFELPVITTGYGGQTDFCTDKTSWLLDFNFEFAKTHLSQHTSVWATPTQNSLHETILNIYNSSNNELKQKTLPAKEYILQNYSSSKITKNILMAINKYDTLDTILKIGLFSTYNTKCGIAKYSSFTISEFVDDVTIFADYSNELIKEDLPNTIRCWTNNRETKDIEPLKNSLLIAGIKQLIIQYNFSFLPLSLLQQLIEFCVVENIKIYLFLHSTQDVITQSYTDSFSLIKDSLNKVDFIFVHTLSDLNYLKNKTIYKNTYLATHGVDSSLILQKTKNNPIPTIATFGFLLPQKGILELIDITEILHKRGQKVNLLLLNSIHPAPISKELKNHLIAKIQNSFIKEYITFIDDFLTDREIVTLLSNADKIIFPYKNTQESSSAAVRMGLLSLNEVITTPLKIFDDVKKVVTQSSSCSLEHIADTVETSLKKDFDNTNQQLWIEQNSWQKISKNLYNTIKSKKIY